MENKITIQKENLLKAYYRATLEQRALLEDIFGEEMFQPKDIKERVKTFEDACEELGEEHPLVKEYWGVVNVNLDITQDLIAYLKLRIISAALNGVWEPMYTEEEYRWYPWFLLWTEKELKDKSDEWKTDNKLWLFGGSSEYDAQCGLAVGSSDFGWSVAYPPISARLAVKSKELATYFGKKFIDIWADFLFA